MPRFGGRNNQEGLSEEDLRRNPPPISKDLLIRIFKYLRPYRWQMLGAGTAIIAAAALDMMPSILSGKIIDEGLAAKNLTLVAIYCAICFGVLLVSNLINIVQTYINAYVAQRISTDMRNQMYGHLQKMAQRFFTNSKQGEIITRMTSDISGIESIITGTIASTVSNVAMLLTSLAAMFSKNWILAIVGMLIVPLFVLPTKSVARKRWALTTESQKKRDQINQILNETLSVSGQQLVKLFTNEDRELHKYQTANEEIFKLRVREEMTGRWFRMAVNTFASLGPILIYLTAGILMIRMDNSSLTIGDVTVMVALLSRMYRPVNQLLGIQIEFTRAIALFSRIFDYMDLPVEINNCAHPIVPKTFRGDVQFDHVDFQYKDDAPLLKDLNFFIPAGQTIAIVGPSGAGKSSLVNLLTRTYDVTSGNIKIDGIDIRELDLKYLREKIGVVSQDNYLFNGTIRDNLQYANESAPESELISACKRANIHDYIASLPEGYDTLVGNRGVRLSGGERQRLCIARAILKDPALLIFDEATSSLDSLSENLIQQAIEPLLKKHTSIVIAHRLSTIISADKIIAMKDGKVVEMGTHQELLAKDGLYRELYDTQFAKALEDQPT